MTTAFVIGLVIGLGGTAAAPGDQKVAPGQPPATRPAGDEGWQERFRKLDRSGDGFLSREEVGRDALFNRLDRDGDGRITPAEIRQQGRGAKRARSPEAAKRAAAIPTPTRANVAYGPHPRNVLDFWAAKSDAPAPLIVYIHGGGFVIGDKESIPPSCISQSLGAGASIMSISYRFLPQAPIQDILRDCARAIQYVRYHASEFHIDAKRVAAFGGSAGGGTSLWLAVHDDLADARAADPVLRESSRIVAAGCMNAQATYNLPEWNRLVYPIKPEWLKSENEFPDFYKFESAAEFDTPRGRAILADCSMFSLLTHDDPPIMMTCTLPDEPPTSRGAVLHCPRHVEVIREKAGKVGVSMETILRDPHNRKTELNTEEIQPRVVSFLLKHLGCVEKVPAVARPH